MTEDARKLGEIAALDMTTRLEIASRQMAAIISRMTNVAMQQAVVDKAHEMGVSIQSWTAVAALDYADALLEAAVRTE